MDRHNATLGVPYYRVSRIFSVPAISSAEVSTCRYRKRFRALAVIGAARRQLRLTGKV